MDEHFGWKRFFGLLQKTNDIPANKINDEQPLTLLSADEQRKISEKKFEEDQEKRRKLFFEKKIALQNNIIRSIKNCASPGEDGGFKVQITFYGNEVRFIPEISSWLSEKGYSVKEVSQDVDCDSDFVYVLISW